VAAGLYWEWIVRKGRKLGSALGKDYLETRYEDLVNQPAETLARLAVFLNHDLDYGRIQQNSIGSVRSPLTSFKEDLASGHFTPVGRWKDKFPARQLTLFEDAVGDYMQELGYALSSNTKAKHSLAARRMRLVYRNFYDLKQWAKINTPLSRLMVDYSAILIDK
jgi:hypothetical protein